MTAVETTTPIERIAERLPRPWVAALLSLLWAGAGHLYAGERRRAVWLACAQLALVPVVAWSMVNAATNAWSMALPLIVALSGWFWVILDARRAARRCVSPPWRRRHVWAVLPAATVGVWLALGFVEDLVRARIARAVRVPTGAMAPTILPGDYLFLTPVGSSRVARGNLVMWQAPDGREFLHRVVGLPGDTLAMQDTVLLRNGQAVVEPYVMHTHIGSIGADTPLAAMRHWGPLVVPADSVFVLGDNRDNSSDSRLQGFVPVDRVRSWPYRIYFSREPESGRIRWTRIGVRPDTLGAPPA